MSYFHDLATEFRGFPRTVKYFYATDILFGFAQAIFSTLFNLHLLAVGFTAEHIGQTQSVASLVMAGLAIPVGLAADRWGRRWFYVAGSLLFGMPYLIMPWVTSFPLLLAAYTVSTVGNTLMFVNESPLLAGEVGSDKRASVFSFMMINFFVWNTLGIQLAGFLVDWLPAGSLSQYQWPLVGAGLFAVASGAARFFLRWRPQAAQRRALSLRPTRVALLLGLANLLSGGAAMLFFGFNNVILSQRFHFGSATISTILTISGVVGWVGSLVVPYVSRRFGDLKAYSTVIGVQGLLLLLMGLADAPPLFLSAWWFRAVLGTMQMSLFSAFAMGVTPENERATANSYAVVGRNLGQAAAAAAYGALLATASYITAFGLAGLLALSAAVFTLTAFRRYRLVEAESAGA